MLYNTVSGNDNEMLSVLLHGSGRYHVRVTSIIFLNTNMNTIKRTVENQNKFNWNLLFNINDLFRSLNHCI